MGVVGSLPSLPSPSTPNNTSEMSYEESPDECSYSIMTIHKQDIHKNLSSNVNISDDDDNNKSNDSQCFIAKPPRILKYGPINVTVRPSAAPTLATGRRSKFTKLDGDAAIKRELRRKRNREAARKLKEKREFIERQLEKEIRELESEEQGLLLKVKNLELYKEQLEIQHQQIISFQEKLTQKTMSTLKQVERNRQIHQNVPVHYNDAHIKQEPRPQSPRPQSPRPQSPQWQLLFSI
ncbi:unnamed protein product [Rotaria sordida]|uniref:BZIP domain-containing protein n=1 Tax=Rotaria sordida TaxID=392033 RepID=A0A814UVN0_9BILA|nr:unnamed protein product [Rotaria sordida]CAF1179774.1 unnamed protein product [Rotaria sordida]CAF1439984.1 unnamed protein product [Rotaria sordida]CAF4081400.1 unnamed protein product [Rotaria sordida]